MITTINVSVNEKYKINNIIYKYRIHHINTKFIHVKISVKNIKCHTTIIHSVNIYICI